MPHGSTGFEGSPEIGGSRRDTSGGLPGGRVGTEGSPELQGRRGDRITRTLDAFGAAVRARVEPFGRFITGFLESVFGPATSPRFDPRAPEALGPGGERRGASIFGRAGGASFFTGPAFLRRRAAKSQKEPPRFSEAELAAEKARRDLLRLTAAQGRGSTAFASDRRARAVAEADQGSALFNNPTT